MAKLGDVESGLAYFQEAWQVLEKIGSTQSHEAAHVLMNKGKCLDQKGDTVAAIACYLQAFKLREETGTLETRQGALLLRTTGEAQEKNGDINDALWFLEKAR